ncbi:MAG TPA: ferrous iron transport protein B [Candidatus Intestinimonas stercoravium]|uniref:ferrous iron transport protein B n=1 Tax=uncultured Intestinimonas sp. TaxID=1689265 RepID=UPI001FA27A76|nr:ferrous iron transport protein B [uncultured Intestinimonas sp.]HJA63770.1 ferrous iron transport protein B [Candidatus Intestinimonas stercoravium]
MSITIALAGNPNCGKTTMFNALTGAVQFVGNWPGVTVEKKEGKLKGHKDINVMDLPGIYSLSPYTLEEVVARNYLINEKPDVILNLVDASNIERNLYLTTQLLELGIPVVVALNMIDVAKKNGDKIDTAKLSEALGCPVVETSAVKGEGCVAAAERAAALVAAKQATVPQHTFAQPVEDALSAIADLVRDVVPPENQRWFAIKLFERDEKVMENFTLSPDTARRLEDAITACESAMDDDSESIITNERYSYIAKVTGRCVKKGRTGMSTSDRIDRIVTNRVLALPIFALVMLVVYSISMGSWPVSIGTMATDWANDVLFGEIVPGFFDSFLLDASGAPVVAGWLYGLIQDGIVAGVGAVLGFVPQMLVLFLLLCILEDIGYMARIAFIMDRIFRRFGLSGKSFIPMLVATGCGVPGIMASRTIEQDRDRKMTVMTTGFIPCGAKMPIIGLFAGALFGGSSWVAVSAYFIGVAAVIVSGIILKKTKMFAGDPAPFVMELPAYHIPKPINILRGTWERGWSFIKRAGTVILLSSVILWFLQGFGFVDGTFQMVEDNNTSLLASIGNAIAFIFAPLGFGTWKPAVATFTGLIAKENVVGTFGVLYGFAEVAENGDEIWGNIATDFTAITAYSYMIFNLLCAPCFAAMGAIKREMNNWKWTLGAIAYMCGFAYVVSLMVYQFGELIVNGVFGMGTVAAIVCLAAIIYLLFRKGYRGETTRLRAVDAVRA